MEPEQVSADAIRDAIRLESLTLSGFRNLGPLTFEPGPRFNVIFGDNGAGKSNLLEAVTYLATLGSFRDAKKEDMVALNAPRALMRAKVSGRPLSREYKIALERESARVVTVDGKRPSSLGSYYEGIQLVLFHPGHVDLMAGGPEPRRAFLDRVLEQVDASYARSVADYGKALRSRNRLLKQEQIDVRSIRAYDPILAELGARIGQARAKLVAELKPLTEGFFAEITEHALPLEMTYAARHRPDEQALREALAQSFEKDRARGFTGVGPHGDDLRVGVEKSLVKHLASQGQHRALVLSLKVSELFVLARRTGRMPLFVLDDVSSELDRSRNSRFFRLLSRLGAQVFLSTTHREFILLESDEPQVRVDFQMERGELKRVG
ncbi:MAG: DNA replication/repair protein RecF [Myxococcales bacterium]